MCVCINDSLYDILLMFPMYPDTCFSDNLVSIPGQNHEKSQFAQVLDNSGIKQSYTKKYINNSNNA